MSGPVLVVCLCAIFANFFIIPKYSFGFVCLISLAQPLPSPVPCAVTSLSAYCWQSSVGWLFPCLPAWLPLTTTSWCDCVYSDPLPLCDYWAGCGAAAPIIGSKAVAQLVSHHNSLIYPGTIFRLCEETRTRPRKCSALPYAVLESLNSRTDVNMRKWKQKCSNIK